MLWVTPQGEFVDARTRPLEFKPGLAALAARVARVEGGCTVLPLAIGILIGLFMLQARGTARVGLLFGPIMTVYFVTIAVLGITHLVRYPQILGALSPHHALAFFADEPVRAFLALGSVVLAVTGAEALYADMGHFGRKPIRVSWLWFVLPALMLNYLGQGAMIASASPARALTMIRTPFFLLAPDSLRLPLVILATMATVIASQAVISGAYSVTQQAVQLGFLPRLRIEHTSAAAMGQIYVPLVNWALLVLVVALVLGFRSSDALAAAYGIAVTGTMFITALMLGVLTVTVWRWPKPFAYGLTGLFVVVDGLYFASNATKIPDGGWFPLLVAAVAFTLLTTWAKGRRLMRARLAEGAMPAELFARSTRDRLERVRGTAVFLSSSREGVPHALLHNVKHNKVLHDHVIIVTVLIGQVPNIGEDSRLEVHQIDARFVRAILHYGFMDEIDVPTSLASVRIGDAPIRQAETSYFLGRQTLIAAEQPGMALWREQLFAWMVRNAESAMDFFKLPINRVVELGSQLEI